MHEWGKLHWLGRIVRKIGGLLQQEHFSKFSRMGQAVSSAFYPVCQQKILWSERSPSFLWNWKEGGGIGKQFSNCLSIDIFLKNDWIKLTIVVVLWMPTTAPAVRGSDWTLNEKKGCWPKELPEWLCITLHLCSECLNTSQASLKASVRWDWLERNISCILKKKKKYDYSIHFGNQKEIL